MLNECIPENYAFYLYKYLHEINWFTICKLFVVFWFSSLANLHGSPKCKSLNRYSRYSFCDTDLSDKWAPCCTNKIFRQCVFFAGHKFSNNSRITNGVILCKCYHGVRSFFQFLVESKYQYPWIDVNNHGWYRQQCWCEEDKKQ